MSEVKPILKIKIKGVSKSIVGGVSGVFIHWGIYSIPAFSPRRKRIPKTGVYNGSEWYLGRLKNPFLYKYETREYHNVKYGPYVDNESAIKGYYDLILEFEEANKEWDALTIVNKIKGTGAKYIIITAKHHDGICIYPSKYGMYHTERDYIGELCKATRAAGLEFGIYYSLMEWATLPRGSYSTGRKKVGEYINNVLMCQLKELVLRYEPDILWADGHWHHTVSTWNSDKFLEWLFILRDRPSEKLITNDRWGNDFFEFIYSLPSTQRNLYLSRIYKTGEDRLIKSVDMGDILWEHVNTISNSWGYASNQKPDDYKSKEEIESLCYQVHGGGGRFTLNVGLRPDGTFDPSEEKVLNEIRI